MQVISKVVTNWDGSTTELSYPWVQSDSGRSSSSRPKQKNDCTVRALALATGMGYDTSYDTLKQAGRVCSKGFHIGDWLDEKDWTQKMSFPAIKGKMRMNPAAFTALFPKGKYICRIAKHVFAVVDGVVYDTYAVRPDRCIYSAWKILDK